jgi:cytochrome d ubiquinol oxidase subunit I
MRYKAATMDVELLARIQFAFTIAFHYIFPPLSIGLGIALVIMEGLYLKTRDKAYHEMARFWTKIFGLTFAIGVASGIVMEFEFGTNWATYSRFVGDIFGSALAAEGIFAFFLESGFLAILLFGWDKVGKKLHFFATCMVAFGAHFSAVWIIVANSWQQTPAGSHLEVAGKIVPPDYVPTAAEWEQSRMVIDNFWAVVFNPSTVDRLSHTVIGAWQAGAFLLISVAAFYLLRKRHPGFARRSMKIGLVMAMVSSLLSLVSGHSSAQIVAEHQPSKLAAMEGLYETTSNAPLTLFGWVDTENGRTVGPKIPGALSLLIGGDRETEVTGLNAFSPDLRPPVQATFQFFHFMVTIGMLLILIAFTGGFLWWRGRLWDDRSAFTRGYWWVAVFAVFLPQIANQFGWFAAEIGRQPWIVWGYLRTSDGLSKVVSAQQVLGSLIGFMLIYTLLFALFIYLLNKKIQKGPEGSSLETYTEPEWLRTRPN